MTTWTSDELTKIGNADELRIAPTGHDGRSRNPVTIWVVRNGDDIYVRSYRGTDSSWFRGAQARHQGRIQVGGVEAEVTFAEETDPAVNDQIDAAYRDKYRRNSTTYVDPMLAPQARATTHKLVPR